MFILVTGGSGSGKSEYAEQCIEKLSINGQKRLYVATMIPYGEEGRKRVLKHRKQRSRRNFTTIEKFYDIEELNLNSYGKCCVLLECISNLAANMLFEKKYTEDVTVDRIICGIEKIRKQADNLVVVTNEVFSDGITYDKDTTNYMRVLGRINIKLASIADCVTEVVCLVPVVYKGEKI